MSRKSLVPCKSVLITFHGDTTHATQLTGYDHDTRTKSACAKRNPTDEYNAYEGARIALARLFGVDPFPEMENKEAAPEAPAPEKKLEYKVGARVRIVAPVANVGYAKGDVGTVVRMSDPLDPSKGCDVRFDLLHKVSYCYRSEFELIDDAVEEKPKAAAPEAPKAKVIKDFEVKVTVTPIYEEDA